MSKISRSKSWLQMMRLSLLIAVCVLSFSVNWASAASRNAPKASEDIGSSKWRVVGDWDVWTDRTLNGSCFILRNYERAAVFRIGLNRDASGGYLVLANEAWKSLVVGSKYAIELRFDNRPPWNGNATARQMDKLTVLYMDFAGRDLMDEMARAANLAVNYRGRPAASIGLAGASAAVEELGRCQANSGKVNSASRPNTASDIAPGADPFAQ